MDMDRTGADAPGLPAILPKEEGGGKRGLAFSFFILLLAVFGSIPLRPSVSAQSADDLAAAVQAGMTAASVPIPGLTPDPDAGGAYPTGGIGSMLPGSEDPAVRKKYVYDGASRDGVRFYGVALPKRVFNNVPPRF